MNEALIPIVLIIAGMIGLPITIGLYFVREKVWNLSTNFSATLMDEVGKEEENE